MEIQDDKGNILKMKSFWTTVKQWFCWHNWIEVGRTYECPKCLAVRSKPEYAVRNYVANDALKIVNSNAENIIDCEIETPQFKNGKVWKMQKQSGRHYKSEATFYPDSMFGHKVYFHDIDNFKSALVRLL